MTRLQLRHEDVHQGCVGSCQKETWGPTLGSPFPDQGFTKIPFIISPLHSLPSVLSAGKDGLHLQTRFLSLRLIVSTKSNIYQNASKYDDFISNGQHSAAAAVSSA